MVHDGLVLPDNRIAYEAMNPGWGWVLDGIARVIAQAAWGVRQTRNAFARRLCSRKTPKRDDDSIRSHRV
jgi:hypothetical protein